MNPIQCLYEWNVHLQKWRRAHRQNYHGEWGSSWSYLLPYIVVFLSARCCWIDGDRSMDYCHYHLQAPPCHSISHLSFLNTATVFALKTHIERHTGEKSKETGLLPLPHALLQYFTLFVFRFFGRLIWYNQGVLVSVFNPTIKSLAGCEPT